MNRQIDLTVKAGAIAEPADGANELSSRTILEEGSFKDTRSRLRRVLGPPPGAKEIKALCGGFLVTLLIVSSFLAINPLIRNLRSPQPIPEVDFVYFYGMGHIFNQ